MRFSCSLGKEQHRWDSFSFSNKQPVRLFSSLEYLGCWRLISNDQNHILTSWMNYYTHEGVVRQLCYSCACMNFLTRFIKHVEEELIFQKLDRIQIHQITQFILMPILMMLLYGVIQQLRGRNFAIF